MLQIFYLATELAQDLSPEDKVEEELEVVPASYTSYSLVFLDKYTEYRIQILAFNPAGDGPRSLPVTVRTLQVFKEDPTYWLLEHSCVQFSLNFNLIFFFHYLSEKAIKFRYTYSSFA